MTDTSTNIPAAEEIQNTHRFRSMTLRVTHLGLPQPTLGTFQGKGFLVSTANGVPLASCRSWTETCDFMKKALEEDFTAPIV